MRYFVAIGILTLLATAADAACRGWAVATPATCGPKAVIVAPATTTAPAAPSTCAPKVVEPSTCAPKAVLVKPSTCGPQVGHAVVVDSGVYVLAMRAPLRRLWRCGVERRMERRALRQERRDARRHGVVYVHEG